MKHDPGKRVVGIVRSRLTRQFAALLTLASAVLVLPNAALVSQAEADSLSTSYGIEATSSANTSAATVSILGTSSLLADESATLVDTVILSDLDPPSPDSVGITYIFAP